MLAALAAATLVVAASLALGQALLAISGRRGWSPLAAGVGLAAVIVVTTLAAKLPGRASTAAIALGVASLGALAYLAWSRNAGISALLRIALPAGLLAALAAALPFIANARVGVLGIALVNDDMANHLLMADWVQSGTEPAPELIAGGYPLGVHSLAATLAEVLGSSLEQAFAGLTLAIAALGAITALAALERLPPGRRVAAAALAALPYLAAAYLIQGAFKEPLQAFLLIAFVLLLSDRARRFSFAAAIPVAVLVAASVFNYSFPGLFWLAGAAAVWWIATSPSPRALAATARRGLMGAASVAALAALLTLPDWTRILEFTTFGAFDPVGEQTGLGNLRGQLSPLQALGIWPSGEFRITPQTASLPAIVFWAGGLLAAVALALGIGRAIRERHRDPTGLAILSALAAATVIYVGTLLEGTPYTAAKALAIASPPAILLSLRALLTPSREPESTPTGHAGERKIRTPRGREMGMPTGLVWRRPGGVPISRQLIRSGLAVFFTLAAAGSSFLVLRSAPISPPDHLAELAAIREVVTGDDVLFLGRDDFIAWHLRGASVSTHIQNFFSTERVPARVDPPDGEKFDFDAVTAETLDRFDWVLTTRSDYASLPPQSVRLAIETPSYLLWAREASTTPRRILDEGTAPGAVLDCDGPGGSLAERGGETATWGTAPAEGREAEWRPEATVTPGRPARQPLELEGGREWQISLAYDSPRPLELRVSAVGGWEERLELPANLDFRGPTPPFAAGTVTPPAQASRVEVEVSLTPAPLAGRLLGAEGEAHLRGLFAVSGRGDGPAELGRACGEYVDWFR